MRTWWLVLAMGAVACGGSSDVDDDADGFAAGVDCDDTNADVNPDAVEVCDGIDNDCNGLADDEEEAPPADAVERWSDADGDGFGGGSLGRLCAEPPNTVLQGGDCDDAIVGTNPVTSEVCDGIDNDCDGLIDDADPNWARGPNYTWYRDSDNDGYGSTASFIEQCAQPEGYVSDDGDCDDADDERNPGAPEICDGKDNNCDVSAGPLVDDEDPALDPNSLLTWYVDADGDGHGSATTIQICNPLTTPNVAPEPDDCNDGRDDIYPGATELCDGTDYNCDGLMGADNWADQGQAYRVIVSTQAPAHDTQGAPLGIDVDFPALLGEVGDAGMVDLASVRVVLQDCDLGFPEVPAEFVDDVEGLFAATVPNALTDDVGTLVFRDDTDGNLSTVETRAASGVRDYAVYFSSTTVGAPSAAAVTAPSMTFGGGGTPGAMSHIVDNGITRLELSQLSGGTVTFLGPSGTTTSVGAQADSAPGNGVYFAPTGGGPTGGWATAPSDASSGLVPVHQGTMLAAYEATGSASNAYGAFDYRYTYVMLNGRPEVYARVRYTTTVASHVGPQGTFWSQAVRPWQIDNNALLAGGAATSVRDAAYRWVRGTYLDDTRGVFLAWRNEPAHRANPVITGSSRYLGLAGQDVNDTPVANESDVASGARLLDDALLVAYTYTGAWSFIESDAMGTMEGMEVTMGTAEVNPALLP